MTAMLMGCPKLQLDDLAIFGKLPAFAGKLQVGRPNVGDRERLLERSIAMLDRNSMTSDGAYAGNLESRLGSSSLCATTYM